MSMIFVGINTEFCQIKRYVFNGVNVHKSGKGKIEDAENSSSETISKYS